VIQSYPDHRSARKDVIVKPVNFGTAFKFNRLSPVTFVQPPSAPDVKGEVNVCVFRCDQQNGVKNKSGKEQWEVKVLERHEFSSQAFVPMAGGGARYLVLVCAPAAGESYVALGGEDDCSCWFLPQMVNPILRPFARSSQPTRKASRTIPTSGTTPLSRSMLCVSSAFSLRASC
jgi:hypothetical protein